MTFWFPLAAAWVVTVAVTVVATLAVELWWLRRKARR